MDAVVTSGSVCLARECKHTWFTVNAIFVFLWKHCFFHSLSRSFIGMLINIYSDAKAYSVYGLNNTRYTARIWFEEQKVQHLICHSLIGTGCMRDLRLSGRYIPLDGQPREGVSVVSSQGVSLGCSSDSCRKNQCSPPFTCVDLWRIHECRYTNIYIQSIFGIHVDVYVLLH